MVASIPQESHLLRILPIHTGCRVPCVFLILRRHIAMEPTGQFPFFPAIGDSPCLIIAKEPWRENWIKGCRQPEATELSKDLPICSWRMESWWQSQISQGRVKRLEAKSASTQETEGRSAEFKEKRVHAHYRLKETEDLARIGNDSSARPSWEWQPNLNVAPIEHMSALNILTPYVLIHGIRLKCPI